MNKNKKPTKFKLIIDILNEIKNRFDSLENRFDSLENRFDSLENRFDGLENRFDDLENKVDTIDGKLSDIDSNLNLTLQGVSNMSTAQVEMQHSINNIWAKQLEMDQKLGIILDKVDVDSDKVIDQEKILNKHSKEISKLDVRVKVLERHH